MALKRSSLSKNKIEQSFNLKDLLGYSPTEAQKRAFFEAATEAIVERTSSGKDIKGQEFKQYTKEYAQKKGVTRGSVDLILTGEMLTSFEESGSKGDKVKIAMKPEVTGKAHGNITGSYGKPTGSKSKARDFFGFRSKEDLKPILDKVDALKPVEEGGVDLGGVRDLAELRAAVNTNIALEFEGFDGES